MFRFGYLTNLTNFSSPCFRSSGSNMSPSGGSSAQFAVGDLVQVPSINDATKFLQLFDHFLPHVTIFWQQLPRYGQMTIFRIVWQEWIFIPIPYPSILTRFSWGEFFKMENPKFIFLITCVENMSLLYFVEVANFNKCWIFMWILILKKISSKTSGYYTRWAWNWDQYLCLSE